MAASNKKLSAKVIISMVLLIIFSLLAPVLISRKWDWWEAWAYALSGLISFIISRVIAAKKNPGIIAERGNALHHKDIKPFDKILAPLVGIFNLLTLVVAGIEITSKSYPFYSLEIRIAALIIMLAGYAFGSWALIENKFFSGVVRIQKDRGHTVVSTGPYAWIRHPGYSSGMLSYLATPFLLDSLWGIIPAVLTCAALLIRTSFEDKTLQNELTGYKDYAQKVKYKIFPGIW